MNPAGPNKPSSVGPLGPARPARRDDPGELIDYRAVVESVALVLGAVWRNRSRATAVFLGLIVGADLGYGLSYEIAEDKDAYYLPILIATAILAGIGTAGLLQFIRRKFATRNSLALLGALVIGALPAWPYSTGWGYYPSGLGLVLLIVLLVILLR